MKLYRAIFKCEGHPSDLNDRLWIRQLKHITQIQREQHGFNSFFTAGNGDSKFGLILNFSGLRTLKSVTPTLTLDFLEGHKFLIASAAFAESRQDFGGLGGLQLLLHSQQLSGFPFISLL